MIARGSLSPLMTGQEKFDSGVPEAGISVSGLMSLSGESGAPLISLMATGRFASTDISVSDQLAT